VPRSLAVDHGRVLYTPDTLIVVEPPRLWAPHLRGAFRRGRTRAERTRRSSPSVRRLVVLFTVGSLTLATLIAFFASQTAADVGIVIVVVYFAAVLVASAAATLRHQSLTVGALAAAGILCTHLAYAAGLSSIVVD